MVPEGKSKYPVLVLTVSLTVVAVIFPDAVTSQYPPTR